MVARVGVVVDGDSAGRDGSRLSFISVRVSGIGFRFGQYRGADPLSPFCMHAVESVTQSDCAGLGKLAGDCARVCEALNGLCCRSRISTAVEEIGVQRENTVWVRIRTEGNKACGKCIKDDPRLLHVEIGHEQKVMPSKLREKGLRIGSNSLEADEAREAPPGGEFSQGGLRGTLSENGQPVKELSPATLTQQCSGLDGNVHALHGLEPRGADERQSLPTPLGSLNSSSDFIGAHNVLFADPACGAHEAVGVPQRERVRETLARKKDAGRPPYQPLVSAADCSCYDIGPQTGKVASGSSIHLSTARSIAADPHYQWATRSARGSGK